MNQIATLDGASLSYDARGNLTGVGGLSYTYDAFNRLTVAGPLALVYDPAGRLYETSASGSATTRFLYDGLQAIAEYNTSGVLQRRYVPGAGLDEHLVWYEGAGTSDRRWFVQDERNSVVATTDGSGASLAINSYDEYGAPAPGNAGLFGFTGQMYLPQAGLYHYRARAYSPALGRFLQTDPIGGLNLYAYVGNDPINFIDPLGLQRAPHPDGGGTGGPVGNYDFVQDWSSWNFSWAPERQPWNPDCWDDPVTEEFGCDINFCADNFEVCLYIRDWQRAQGIVPRRYRESGDRDGGEREPSGPNEQPSITDLPYPQRAECERLAQGLRDERLRAQFAAQGGANVAAWWTGVGIGVGRWFSPRAAEAGAVAGAVFPQQTLDLSGAGNYADIMEQALLRQGAIQERQREQGCVG